MNRPFHQSSGYRSDWQLCRIPIALYCSLLFSLCSGCAGTLAQLPQRSFDSITVEESVAALAKRNELLGFNALGGAGSNSQVAKEKKLLSVPLLLEQTEPENKPGPLSVNAVDASLSALLFSVAKKAGISLRIHGELSQRVTLREDQVTLDELLQILSEQYSFSWELQNGLEIWSGQPYQHTYSVDYLNIQRKVQSSVGLATQVGTINATNSQAHSIANSSKTRIENSSEHKFWLAIESDLQSLTQSQGKSEPGASSFSSVAKYSINAEAGLLSLFAAPEVHRSVKQYLSLMQESTRRQVLIEAIVVEVSLSDNYQAGVDWQLLSRAATGLNAAQVLVGAPFVNSDTVDRLAADSGLFSLVHSSSTGDFRATLSLLEKFGDVRIVSKPRIIALNNQASVLKVVDNRVYFTTTVERSLTDKSDDIKTSTQIHTVPVGLVMNVTPQISADNAIMLNVRPTLSRIIGFVNDPNPELAIANVQNGVPEIQVREMETMLQVQSGDFAIIGGLMQESTDSNNARIPGVGRLPIARHLFTNRREERRQTELLVVLRPTVQTLKKSF